MRCPQALRGPRSRQGDRVTATAVTLASRPRDGVSGKQRLRVASPVDPRSLWAPSEERGTSPLAQ
jgi:hypothetical protein